MKHCKLQIALLDCCIKVPQLINWMTSFVGNKYLRVGFESCSLHHTQAGIGLTDDSDKNLLGLYLQAIVAQLLIDTGIKCSGPLPLGLLSGQRG